MKALIFQGGWNGHEPGPMSQILSKGLEARGFEVQVSDTLDVLLDAAAVSSADVIVPLWTMGTMTNEQFKALNEAVKAGTGLAGFHGGMGDAFRGRVDYEWMVGGIFVGHPYVGEYKVRLTPVADPITADLPEIFSYNSEQYYMLVDPGNRVLAETMYTLNGQRVMMPVIWTRRWGQARVFYSALGHKASEFTDYPAVLEMTLRGIVWAAQGKAQA